MASSAKPVPAGFIEVTPRGQQALDFLQCAGFDQSEKDFRF
jgi:hypothetical protein